MKISNILGSVTAHKISEANHLVKVRFYAHKILHCPADFRVQKSCKFCHPCKDYGPGDVISLQSYASIFHSNNRTSLVIPRQEVCRWTLTQHLVYNALTAKSTASCPGFWLSLIHLISELSLTRTEKWEITSAFIQKGTKKSGRCLKHVYAPQSVFFQGKNIQDVGVADEPTNQQQSTVYGMERKSQEHWYSMSDRRAEGAGE